MPRIASSWISRNCSQLSWPARTWWAASVTVFGRGKLPTWSTRNGGDGFSRMGPLGRGSQREERQLGRAAQPHGDHAEAESTIDVQLVSGPPEALAVDPAFRVLRPPLAQPGQRPLRLERQPDLS